MNKTIIVIYNLLNIMLLPIFVVVFTIRIIRGKDNLHSVMQRFCLNKANYIKKETVWVHAASVGESMIALNLVKELSKEDKDYFFLVTTSTISSSKILAKSLPSYAIHQFVPIDNYFIVKSFLKHWQPKFAIFVESELWPCLLSEASKKMKVALVNARISDKSFRNWKKARWLFNLIMQNFAKIIVQSESDLNKYKNLGCLNAINLGNLKFSNKELDVNDKEFNKLDSLFKGKKVFIASSTHHIDETITLEIIKNLRKSNLDYFPIIVLRHPERSMELTKICDDMGLKYSVRSKGEDPDIAQDLYVVDSFGELGLFYKLSYITFVGGSFKHGGHNLLEPAYFNNVILLGPDMSNFKNISEEMIKSEAAVQVKNSIELEQIIKYFLDIENIDEAKKIRANALQFVDDRREIMDNYINEIKNVIAL